MLEVPGYRIEGELGSGGMGAVYRGVLQSTGEAVAIKLLRDHVGDPEGLERFRREAQVLAEFAHLGILSAREFGVVRGTPFLVTDLVEGETLRQVVERSGPLSEGEVRYLGSASPGPSATPTSAGSSTGTSNPRTSCSPALGSRC